MPIEPITPSDNPASATGKVNRMLASLLGRPLALHERVSLYAARPVWAAKINRLLALALGNNTASSILPYGPRRGAGGVNAAFEVAFAATAAPGPSLDFSVAANSGYLALLMEDF